MKLKKKLLAVVACAALLVTQAIPALAEGDNIQRTGELTITKNLTLDQNTNFAPKEKFTFTITPSDNLEQGKKIDNLEVKKGVSLQNATDISVEFNNTKKPTDGTKKLTETVKFNFKDNATFNQGNPAIYRYEVAETKGQNEDKGVVYDETKFLLDVYVDKDGNPVALVAYKLVNGQKQEGKVPLEFNNEYKTESLTIDKKIAGVSADPEEEFTFRLTVEASETLEANTEINATKTKKDKTTENKTLNVGQEKEFTLKGDESLALGDLPVGTKYTITEDKAEGYEKSVSFEVSKEQDPKVDGGYVIQDGANKVSFTNTNDDFTPTGLILTVAPYAAGLILVAGLAFLLVAKRRRVNE